MSEVLLYEDPRLDEFGKAPLRDTTMHFKKKYITILNDTNNEYAEGYHIRFRNPPSMSKATVSRQAAATCFFSPRVQGYRGTSLIRTPPPVGPCSSPMPRALWCS